MHNRLYCIDPGSGVSRDRELPCYTACIGETGSGDLIPVSGLGWVLWDEENAVFKPYAPVPFDAGAVRFNDGKVGPDGSLWVGTMDLNASKPIGSLFRVTAAASDGYSVQKVETGLVISNGIGWSPDERYMYLTDSFHTVIYRYKFDLDTCFITNRSVFVQDPERPGVLDGLAVDEEGNVWSARWGCGKVVCYDPSGKPVDSISVPARQPSSCCFGGKNMGMLFITSARYRIKEEEIGELDSVLFVCETGVRGMKGYTFSV